MKQRFLLLILIFGSSLSCNKDVNEDENTDLFKNLSADKYYSSDILPEKYQACYGDWFVTGTSGGLHGNGYTKDFEEFYIKKNGIFGIVRNDSLIAYGKMVINMDNHGELLCKFEFDKKADIQIFYDNEKYLKLINQDSLTLEAPCCDRYNIHLRRKKIK